MSVRTLHARSRRLDDRAESCLVSISDETHANSPSLCSNEQLSGGIVDLYANRMAAVATKVETVRQ